VTASRRCQIPSIGNIAQMVLGPHVALDGVVG
jgi:hypothetical protein